MAQSVNDPNSLMEEGLPFMVTLTTAADDVEVEFILDSETYDSVAEFFLDKMLWVSGLLVEPGAGATIESLRFDDILVWFGQAADEGIDLSGVPYESATPIGFASANVKSKFGVTFLPVRNKFSLKNQAGAAAASKVTLWGVYTKRTA